MRGSASISRSLAALFLWPLLTMTGSAQDAVLQDMHSRGYVGFGYSRDASGSTAAQGLQTSGQGLQQEITTDLQGAVFHPEFISFGSSLSFGHSTVSTSTGLSGGNNAFAGSANLIALPASDYRLMIGYQRTRVGLGQQGFTTTTNTDRLSFDWRLNLEKFPQLAVQHNTGSSWSDVPVATFAPSRSHSSGSSISATDTAKGWEWNAGWMRSKSESDVVLLNTLASLDQSYSLLNANATRAYLGDRGFFGYSVLRNTSQTDQGLLSRLNGVQISQSTTTSLRVTPKLMTSGSLQYYTYSSRGRMASPSDPGDITFVVYYPTRGYTANGSGLYQIHPRISVANAVAYSVASTVPTGQEQTKSYFTNSPSVNGNATWRRVQLAASYGFGYLRTGTSFNRSFGSWGNNASLSASWSHAWISMGGGFTKGHGTSGVLPGSYADTTNYSFNAESGKLRRIGHLRFRWQLLDRAALGSTGFHQSRRSTWSLALTRRRWQVEGGGSKGSGAAQVFGSQAITFQPLPELVGQLLYEGVVRSYFVSGSGTLHRNLRINARYRKDLQEVPVVRGMVDYSLYEVFAEYQIGKITTSASFGHYAALSDTLTSRFGSSANRFRFRIVRTFDLL